MPSVSQIIQDNYFLSYFQNFRDVDDDYLQSQELQMDNGDSSCEEMEKDDFDADNFDFHDDSNFREFLWPLEMLHTMEQSRGGSKRMRQCSLHK